MLRRIFITFHLRWISLWLIIFFMLSVSPAAAFSLSIDPPHLNLDVSAGQSTSGIVRVENLGEENLKVEVFTEDWLYSPDGSKNFYPAGSTKLSCSKWIKLDPTSFELAPKSFKEVRYALKVPDGVSGGHYGVIFFKAGLGKGMLEGQMVTLAGRIGTIVYQSSGQIIKKGSIVNASITKDKKTNEQFIALSFKNEGNVNLLAKGKIIILDKSGKTVDTVQVDNLNTLPGDVMTKKIKYEKELSQGMYTLDIELDYGGETKAKLNKIVLYKDLTYVVKR